MNELPVDAAHIKRVIGIDTGEKYAVGCCMKLVNGYQKVDNKLAYNGDISNLVIKSKALSEPTIKYSKWLQSKKTAEIFELERSLEKRTAENWSDILAGGNQCMSFLQFKSHEKQVLSKSNSTTVGPSCKWNFKNEWCWNETKI